MQQRIQFVADLLEQNLSADQFKTDWKLLENEMERLLPTRNIIVHHPAKRTGTSKNGKAVYIYAIHIEPYERLLNKKYKGLKGKQELEIADLKNHAFEVLALETKLSAFVQKLTRAAQGAP